jgi:hypothetical protein
MKTSKKKMKIQGKKPTFCKQKKGDRSADQKKNQRQNTHKLETAEGGTCQDTERKLPSEGHSRSEERREKARSGHKEYPRVARG